MRPSIAETKATYDGFPVVPGSLIDAISEAARANSPFGLGGDASLEQQVRVGIIYQFDRTAMCAPSPSGNNVYHAGELTMRDGCTLRQLHTGPDGVPAPRTGKETYACIEACV